MIQYFRNNQLYAGLLLIFYVLLLRLSAWWLPIEELSGVDVGAGVFGHWYVSTLAQSKWMSIVIPSIVLFITAITANRLVANERMSRKITQLPGLFILLLASLAPTLIGAHSCQLANLFLLFALFPLFRLYRTSERAVFSFNAGFWLGLAVLCNAYYLVFLLLLVLGGGSLSTLRLRMIFQFITGCFIPIFLTATLYFWFRNEGFFFERQLPGFGGWSYNQEAIWNLGGVVTFSGVLGFSVFKQASNVKLLNIESRKKVNIIYWWLLFSGLAFILTPVIDAASLQYMVVPLGIILSLPFTRGSRNSVEAGHLFLLLIAILLNVYPLLV